MRSSKKMSQAVDRQKRMRAFRGKLAWSGDLNRIRKDRTTTMKNDSVTAPKGFWGAGVASGVKASGKADLGLLVCPTGATAAAVFHRGRSQRQRQQERAYPRRAPMHGPPKNVR